MFFLVLHGGTTGKFEQIIHFWGFVFMFMSLMTMLLSVMPLLMRMLLFTKRLFKMIIFADLGIS